MMTKEKNTNGVLKNEKHFVVAIGASAGGLEAIHEFFDNMPETKNLSFVIIQHLSPDHKSLLVDLVARHTHMHVYEAQDNLEIERNCVYVIPNNKFITIKGNKLVLTDKAPLKFPNNAIDVFIQSLSRELKSQGIAVILSGTGTDGTKGIKSLKECGGLVIVQQPESSRFDGMPNSAIISGNVDYVLTPRDIPHQILNYVAENNGAYGEEIDDEMLAAIFNQVRELSGLDFHYYKTPTLTRRVLHRIKKSRFSSVHAYYNFLKDNEEECKQLGKEILINVTRFFRDPEAFEFLKSKVLPDLIKSKEDNQRIKIWVCACSSGEEAYSLAILLEELLVEMNVRNISYKIFATDAEKTNIDIASKGFYPTAIESDVSRERLDKYFTKKENGYTIIPRIRKQIVFTAHNIIQHPPFVKNDLVTCRNMLIYMNSALQQRLYSILAFAVNMHGYLFLGSTENPNPIAPLLKELSAKWKIFRKIADAKVGPLLEDLSDNARHSNGRTIIEKAVSIRKKYDLWEEFKSTLFNDFNFAAFYIDRNFEIKEAVGNYDHILALPKKVLKLQLARMLPGAISTRLIAEIKNAWRTNDRIVIDSLSFRQNDYDIYLQALVQPESQSRHQDCTLVAFHFMRVKINSSSDTIRHVASEQIQNDYVWALEEELAETKNNLQFAIEDLESANEELQSSNEELLSANEELQSSNEELQSLNEELHTLNTEHQLKIKELIELNDDLTNYFRSSNVGQIFIDLNMIIRKFNPASQSIINLIESDIGRPITHIATNVRYSEFVQDIESVIESHETVEKEVQLNSGINLLLRIMPYVTRDKQISGAVISFIDITTITNLNNIIRGVFNSSLSAIFALRAQRSHRGVIMDFTIETSNHAAGELLQLEPSLLVGKGIIQDSAPAFLSTQFEHFVRVAEKGQNLHHDIFFEEEKKWFEVVAVKMSDGLVATFTDITQKKTAEERLKKNYTELIAAKQKLKVLNNELEEKVEERTKLLSASEERFRMVARATNDVVWDWNIVNNEVWVSEAFHLKFGYECDNSLTRKEWLQKIHPEEQDYIHKSIQSVINSSKEQWIGEYRFRKSDGTYRHVLDRAYVMQDSFSTPYRMLGSMLDITELKKAEQEIASNVAQRKFLAESMPLIVWTTTSEGQVDFVNRQFELYTGIESKQALGEGWKIIIHPEDLPKLENEWEESARRKLDFQSEVRLKLSNGKFKWNILRARPQKDEQGEVMNWVITTIDIQEQKKIHEILEQKVSERTEELMKINYALEVSNNDLQQFASVASHDLQEPLRKIHLYSNMLEERYSNILGNGATYLSKIISSSRRMKAIINNILNYSKLSAENVEFEQTNLNKLIEEILDDLEIAIKEKDATIKIDRFPIIDTIPGQIRQVFQNIIGNALKFSRDNVPLEIRITVERINQKSFEAQTCPDGAYCRLVIADNGIGFHEKFAKNIFIIFQRLHSKDRYEGTGIGLAIAKKIIEKHNGLITANGEEGKGATFIIILPVHQL